MTFGPGQNNPRRLLCLIGFMGCGKTSVGRLLARQLGWHFVDLDECIERQTGLTISEIFAREGEPAFRLVEHQVLAQAVGRATENERATVLALGGGTIAQPQNLELLRRAGCTLVWLHCPIEELLRRCAAVTNRPLFTSEASFRQLYEERRPFYEQADYRVESTSEPRAVVEQILSLGILERARS